VTVRSDGASDLEGEVVLTPQPEPPPKPGAPPTTTAPVSSQAGPTPSTVVLTVGDRSFPAPGPGLAGSTKPPGASYRVPVSLPGGSEKTLTVMVQQALFGFRVDLVARRGGVVATVMTPVSGRGQLNVLLLSDTVGAEARLKALPGLVSLSAIPFLGVTQGGQAAPSGLQVTQMRSPRDVPDIVLHLAGLDAVVIDDFDTASMSDGQRRAVQDYVSLGGSLVLAGGAAWSRTLGSLPAALAPLRPSGSGPVSLGPLADLVSATTTATAGVATGEVTAGRVVLAAPGGPALVVDSEYRAGRVIQLAYDPLAEPFASDQMLQGLAWDQALGRLTFRWSPGRIGLLSSGAAPALVAEDQLWGSALEGREWPWWPRWAGGLLVVYALVIGPAVVILSRRFRPAFGRVALVAAVTAAGGTCAVAAGQNAKPFESVVEVKTVGASGTVLTTSYRGVRAINPTDTVEVPAGAADTAFTGQPLLGSPWNRVPLPPRPVNRGLGGGTVTTGGEHPEVRLAVRPWALRTVETLSLSDRGPDLDANLRQVDAPDAPGRDPDPPGSLIGPLQPGRVQGTVTNHGPVTVRQLRAQTLEGQASLAEVLAPGETRTVDAPLVPIVGSPTRGTLPYSAEEAVLLAAAGGSFTGPAQVAVAGFTSPPLSAGNARNPKGPHKVGVAVTVVPLKAAETIPYGTGGSHLVAASPAPDGRLVTVFDLTAPAGTGPLSVLYGGPFPESPGPTVPREIYDWARGTWRALPDPAAKYYDADNPLTATEVNNGLVRFRSWTTPGYHPPTATLRLTSTAPREAELTRRLGRRP